MGTADQPITQPADHSAPPPADRGPTWWRLFSRRSAILGSLALVTRLAVVGVSVADPVARRERILLTMVAVSAILGTAALLSMAADVVAARRAGSASYWGGYTACFNDMSGRTPGAAPNNVIDLSSRRPRRRRPNVREADSEPALNLPPSARGHVLAFAAVALLLVGLIVSTLWSPTDQPTSKPPIGGAPAVSGPAAGPSPTSSTATSGTPSTRPSRPSAGPSTAPSSGVPAVLPAAKTPSTDPIGDGTYLVGTDIAAGAWKAGKVLTAPLGGCAYSINSGPTQKPLLTVGPATVSLAVGDKFTTAGCPLWRLT